MRIAASALVGETCASLPQAISALPNQFSAMIAMSTHEYQRKQSSVAWR